MPLSMQAVSDRVGDLILDSTLVRWTAIERVRWANEAMGAILSRRPAAFARRSVQALIAGTYQTVPADSAMLLDIVRNIAVDGITSGRPIRRSDRQLLDDTDPNWQTGTQKAEIRQYTFDDRMPKMFYVYPPAIAGTKVEMLDAALPADIAALTDTLQIGAEYMEAVVNYVCYRCHCKDFQYANAAVAAAFYQAFETSLGVKGQAQNATSPNQPGNSV